MYTEERLSVSQHMNNTINLIEPTLYDQTGHGYSYAVSLLESRAHDNPKFKIWADNRISELFSFTNCTTKGYFSRKFRQVQKFFLYAKLLRKQETIFISTAELLDLRILSFWVNVLRQKAKVVLHFHQFNQKPKKMKKLKEIANKKDKFMIMAPTRALVEIFGKVGFDNCKHMPCPTYTPSVVDESRYKFTKVLYAGAARNDKGFSNVIDLVGFLEKGKHIIPMEVQVSPPNSQRYDKPTHLALNKLKKLNYPHAIFHKDTLNREKYLSLFKGAICLLIYDLDSYISE